MFSSRKTGSASNAYNLTNSLRFRSSASASLSRTPSSATNRTTWTWSAWIKRGDVSTSEMTFFSAGTDGNNFTAFAWNGNNLFFQNYTSGSQVTATSTAVFRDPSAWYHVVLAIDTTQSTASNRAKLYVNGVQQAGFNGSSFSSSQQFWINYTYRHTISARSLSSIDSYTDQYMTEINFIDGQALTPSSFGATSAATGVWQPIKYTGTYGTNGFYLPFTDNSALTTSSNVGLGKDFSGNSNYWTTNNISITSGVTYDSMTDVPTLTSATAANYCVLNPLITPATTTIINGNLGLSGYTAYSSETGTVGVSSGKWYYEFIAQADAMSGITGTPNGSNYPGQASNAYAWDSANATKYNNNTGSSYGSATSAGDIVGVAFDLDSGSITFYKNNISQGTAYTFTPSGTYFPVVRNGSSTNTSVNFGQRPFAYTPPTGFNRLNTFNLPTPTIGATASTQANKYFDATTYTGNNSTQSVTNSGSMQPDFVWVKNRTNAYTHLLYDVIRGVGTLKAISSSETTAEGGMSDNATFGYLSALNSNGFTVVSGSTANSYTNSSSNNYVGWQWKANGSGSTNTAGTITSTVSANTSAGFSIVTYTGTGANATVGHGLGVAPSMIIVKNRTTAGTSWNVYHISTGNTGAMFLESTAAFSADSTRWNNTTPTSTVFSIGSGAGVNQNTNNLVAYCFAQVAGYSAMGSYTGNGSSDGVFVFTGFRPRFVMIKRTDTTANWFIFDTARDTYNAAGLELYPNLSNAEADGRPDLDILSNGMKMRSTATGQNASGGTYIYMAFCESPFKFSNAR